MDRFPWIPMWVNAEEKTPEFTRQEGDTKYSDYVLAFSPGMETFGDPIPESICSAQYRVFTDEDGNEFEHWIDWSGEREVYPSHWMTLPPPPDFAPEKLNATKTIYIAGKMNGLSDMGRKNFREAESRLLNAGYTVLNPASLPYEMDESRYMPICLAMLEAADAVYLLSNWQDSPGARIEKAYAEYQGKEILMEGEIIL